MEQIFHQAMEMFSKSAFLPLPEFHLQSRRRNTSKENLFDGIGNCAVGLAVLQRAEMDGHRQLFSVILPVAQNPGDPCKLISIAALVEGGGGMGAW